MTPWVAWYLAQSALPAVAHEPMKPVGWPVSRTLFVLPKDVPLKLTVASAPRVPRPPENVRVVVPPEPSARLTVDAPELGVSLEMVSVAATLLAPRKLRVPPSRMSCAVLPMRLPEE